MKRNQDKSRGLWLIPNSNGAVAVGAAAIVVAYYNHFSPGLDCRGRHRLSF